MKLTRVQKPDLWNWSPLDQLVDLREEFNRLFDTPLVTGPRRTEFFNGWTPAVDLYEDKDNLIVKVELPGMKRQEIDISVHDGTLTISGEKKHEEKSQDGEPYRSERFFGRFHRTLALPKPVEPDKAKANYHEGLLT